MMKALMQAKAKIDQAEAGGGPGCLQEARALIDAVLRDVQIYTLRDDSSNEFGHFYELDLACREAEKLSMIDSNQGHAIYVYALLPVYSYKTVRRLDTEKKVY